MSTLVAAAAILLLAATAQAVSGFGFALVAVPLLTLATDSRTAVVAVGLAGLVMSLTIAARERAHVHWRTAWLLLATAVVGLPLGLLVLRLAPERLLTALIGVSVLGCTVLVWRNVRLPDPGPTAVAAIGVLVGALSTSTGTNGPPLVAAFHAMGYEPRAFRATLAAVFGGTGVASVLGFFGAGLVTPRVAGIGLAGLPAVGLGWLLGNWLFTRIPSARFRTFVLASLIASSVVTIAHAVNT
jgi:hypothetical protein